jgi:CRP-like cAMP-binding protein
VGVVRSIDDLYRQQVQGMAAARDLNVVKPKLLERQASIVRQAIADFNAKKLADNISALLVIAALAENQRLLDDLEHLERRGQRATDQLTKS